MMVKTINSSYDPNTQEEWECTKVFYCKFTAQGWNKERNGSRRVISDYDIIHIDKYMNAYIMMIKSK